MRAPRTAAAIAPVAIRATAPQPITLTIAPTLAGPTPGLLASVKFLHQVHSYRDIAAAVYQLQTESAAVAEAARKKLEVKK